MNKEQLVIEYVERYGIVDYTVKGNIITHYESFYRFGYGMTREIKYKYQYNVKTGVTTTKCVKGAKFQ